MKFADKEASEELYKLLKETGIEVPESEFSWYKFNGATYKKPLTETEASYIAINEFGGLQGCLKHRLHSAYSFDEIWNILPVYLHIGKNGKFEKFASSERVLEHSRLYYEYMPESGQAKIQNNNITQAASELLIWVIKSHKEEFVKYLENV